MADDYPYNDDLLLEENDRAHIRLVYPSVAEALIFPELGEVVKDADTKANAGKSDVWKRGLSAVVFVTISLLLASAAPLYAEFRPYSEWAAMLAAGLGIWGAVQAILNRQTDWQEHRLVTELARQFHFRYLIEKADHVVSAANAKDFTGYHSARNIALTQFCQDVVARKPGTLSAIIEDSEAPKDVIGELPALDIFNSEHGQALLLAYRNLRILRQRDYAQHKLSKKGTLFSKFSTDQSQTIKYTSAILLAFLFFAHVGSALFLTFGHEDFNKWLEFIGISIALLALALRAIEEGLKPKAEIERYRHYQAVTRRALEEFDKGDTRSKLEAVKTLERAAYDELTIFLKAHEEAGFKM